MPYLGLSQDIGQLGIWVAEFLDTLLLYSGYVMKNQELYNYVYKPHILISHLRYQCYALKSVKVLFNNDGICALANLRIFAKFLSNNPVEIMVLFIIRFLLSRNDGEMRVNIH